MCTFTVAVNRRRQSAEAGQREADFFRVTTWRQLAENCNRFLAKGRKVGVSGTLMTLQNYTGNDGQQRYSLESAGGRGGVPHPKGEGGEVPNRAPASSSDTGASGFVEVDERLPF